MCDMEVYLIRSDLDLSENSSTSDFTLRCNKKLKEKGRRSSVFLIDLNKEDTQIAGKSSHDAPNSYDGFISCCK